MGGPAEQTEMQGIEFKNKGEIQYWYVPFTIEGDRKKLDTEGDQESGNLDTRDQGDFFNFGAENCSFQFGNKHLCGPANQA